MCQILNGCKGIKEGWREGKREEERRMGTRATVNEPTVGKQEN